MCSCRTGGYFKPSLKSSSKMYRVFIKTSYISQSIRLSPSVHTRTTQSLSSAPGESVKVSGLSHCQIVGEDSLVDILSPLWPLSVSVLREVQFIAL